MTKENDQQRKERALRAREARVLSPKVSLYRHWDVDGELLYVGIAEALRTENPVYNTKRQGETEITIHLKPEDVVLLDSARGRKTRSAWVSRLLNKEAKNE